MRGRRSGPLWLAISACVQDLVRSVNYIDISYSESMQPLIDISVGGQWLKLVYDASSGNTAVFVKETKACVPATEECYSYNDSYRRGSVKVCRENEKSDCDTGQGSTYKCEAYDAENISKVTARSDTLIIDGVQYDQKGIEARDNVSLWLNGHEEVEMSTLPVRLYVKKMVTPHVSRESLPLGLFENSDGIFGASGLTLSCRAKSVWDEFLKRHHWSSSLLIFDFYAPPQAAQAKLDDNQPSRIRFDEIDSLYQGQLIWSQPKQTGDVVNDGMHEFLIYHPKVCGIDLLYNTSSNWLAVIDTSGPCLTLPAFFFDRVRSRIALDCPFAEGEPSLGRLCAPKRGPDGVIGKLPNLYFELEDTQEPEPPQLVLPLDRLVFNNGTKQVQGQDFLCVARADSEATRNTADMMFAHVAIGSLAVAAFYTVVNLDNKTVGLAPRGRVSEGSDGFCIDSVKCMSPMQTYYPPRNVCEDPPCSEYLFMKLDETTKMCVWSGALPLSFGILLVALVVLDLLSHKLYKQAIDKASEFRT